MANSTFSVSSYYAMCSTQHVVNGATPSNSKFTSWFRRITSKRGSISAELPM